MVSDQGPHNKNPPKGNIRRSAFEMTESALSEGEEIYETESDGEEFHIVTRKEWGAKKFKKDIPRIPIALYVYCLNSFSRDCKGKDQCSEVLRRMQAAQMTEPFFLPDIRFNFLIHENGTIYEGRGWGYEPSLPSQYSHHNDKALLFGYISYFTEKTIGSRITDSRDSLIEFGIENNYIAPQYELKNLLMMPR